MVLGVVGLMVLGVVGLIMDQQLQVGVVGVTLTLECPFHLVIHLGFQHQRVLQVQELLLDIQLLIQLLLIRVHHLVLEVRH
jgi:hypothetical protein